MTGARLRLLWRLFAVAFPVYFVWEMAQAPAFEGMPAGWWAATAVCAQATFGDYVIVVTLWTVGALGFWDPQWFVPPTWRRYAFVTAAALAVQVMLEWLMVYRFHRWSYGHQPLVPGLRVGVLPVAQAIVLPPLVFGLVARWEQRRVRSAAA